MLNTNIKKMKIKKNSLFLLLFFCSFYTYSSVIENILQKKEYSEWNYFFVSEKFENRTSRSSAEVASLFGGKKVVFNSDLLTITDACTYKYAPQLSTPLSFWMNYKTVKFYEVFFSDYKIKIPDKFLDITPINLSEKCDFPFSEFIVLDDEVVFFYESYAVFYFKSQEALKSHEKKLVGSDIVVDKKTTGSSSVCKKSERNPDGYNSSRECFYKDMSLISTYKEYREESASYGGKYLQKEIIPNKDFSVQCDDGCIGVIYKWNGPDHLVVTQQFDGGETEISFSKEEQGSRVVTNLFPD